MESPRENVGAEHDAIAPACKGRVKGKACLASASTCRRARSGGRKAARNGVGGATEFAMARAGAFREFLFALGVAGGGEPDDLFETAT